MLWKVRFLSLFPPLSRTRSGCEGQKVNLGERTDHGKKAKEKRKEGKYRHKVTKMEINKQLFISILQVSSLSHPVACLCL